jgi:hypothetical protein
MGSYAAGESDMGEEQRSFANGWDLTNPDEDLAKQLSANN